MGSVLRGGRRLLRFTVAGLLLFGVLAGVGVAAASTRDGGEPAASVDSPSLSFTTPAGVQSTKPYFQITGAYPGMSPQVAVMTLKNESTVPAAYGLTVAATNHPATPALADVLNVQVSNGRRVLYRGALSDLVVNSSTPLGAHSTVSYRVAITWPDGGVADNQYQGASVEFAFIARESATL